MRRRLKIFLCLLTLASLGPAQVEETNFVSKVGTTAAKFLSIPVGARAIGLGQAYAALADDPSAAFWNPAGLGRIRQPTLFAASLNWISDLQLHSVALAFHEPALGSFAVSLNTLRMGEIEVTTLEKPEGSGGTAKASDTALSLSFARSLTDKFTLGISGKWIHTVIANEAASALAIDLGTRFEPGWHGLKVGMALTNLGSKMRLDGRDLDIAYDQDPLMGSDAAADGRLKTQDWNLPTSFRLGIAFDLIKSETIHWVAAIDAIHATDISERANLGTEISLGDFSLRGGLGLNYDQPRLSAGGGYVLKIAGQDIRLDYAAMVLDPFGLTQSFAVGLNF